jgi:flavin-dependent dehydrogenase
LCDVDKIKLYPQQVFDAAAKGGQVAGSQDSTDVFIVGGGPAGLAAAIAARQKGFRVMVADGSAPAIDKSCGEGMMPETLDVLGSLGVQFEPGEGRNFRGISFMQGDAQVSADFPRGQGIALRRPVLHARLAARAQECGAQFLWTTPVSGIVAGLGDGRVQLPQRTIAARWIIGADGQASRVRKWIGLNSAARIRQRYASRRHYRLKPWSNYMEIHWANNAQAYVTPTSEEEVCVVLMAQNRDDTSFDRALDDIPALKEKLSGAQLSSRERGAISVMRALKAVYKSNVALLGDASGGVDAITGDGLRLAFAQAISLADAMAANDLTKYQKAHRKLARRPLLMSGLMLWLSRHPRMRSRMVRVMQNNPESFSRLMETHTGTRSPLRLVASGAQLGFRFLTDPTKMEYPCVE